MNFTTEQLKEFTLNDEAFSQQVPGLQILWSASSIETLKDCPRKYALSRIMGYQEESPHLTFGTIYHECQEIYKLALAEGESYQDSLRKAAKHSLEASGQRSETIDEETGEVTSAWLPWESDIPQKNRFTLVRSVIWWAEQFREEDTAGTFKTVKLKDGSPAVEMPFHFDSGIANLLSSEGNYCFRGRLDEGVEHMNLLFIRDAKTTKSTLSPSYFEKFSPNNQMSLYSIVGKICLEEPVDGVMIDAAQVAVNFTRFGRGFAERTPGQLEEWIRDQEYWLRQNETFVKDQYWPQNDTACGKYGGCPFAKPFLGAVCAKDPSVRIPFLNSNFKRRSANANTNS